MTAVTQDREAQKKIISEYLKAADRYIKSAEFPKALDEVKKALEVEPNNMYATAYNERVKVAMEAARKKEEEEHLKKQAEEQKKNSPSPTPKPAETVSRAANAPDAKPLPVPGQPQVPLPASQLPGDDMITKIKKDASDAAEKKTDGRIDLLKQEFTASQQKFQEDIARLAAEAKDALAAKTEAERKLASLQSQPGKGDTGLSSGTLYIQAMELLEKLFKQAWEDGVISPDERKILLVVKNQYGVTDEEFAKLEHGGGATSYTVHLREVWKDGLVTPEEAEKLEALRTTLNISAEEHFRLEAQIRKEMQSKK